MKDKYIGSIFLIFILSNSCKTSQFANKNEEIWSKKYCKLERLELQEIFDTTRVVENGKVKGGVIANGVVILSDKIEIDRIGESLSKGNKIFINRTTLKTLKVSQEFYEKYSNSRKSLCDLIEGIKSGIIQTDVGKERAETLYLDMITMFSGINRTITGQLEFDPCYKHNEDQEPSITVPVNDGPKIQLFSNTNFSGSVFQISSNWSINSESDATNNQISSIIIPEQYKIIVYDYPFHNKVMKGECMSLSTSWSGEYYGKWNDRISSIRVFKIK